MFLKKKLLIRNSILISSKIDIFIARKYNLAAIHFIHGKPWHSLTYFHLFPVSYHTGNKYYYCLRSFLYYCEGTILVGFFNSGRNFGDWGNCPQIPRGISTFQTSCTSSSKVLLFPQMFHQKSVKILLF